VSNMQGSTYGDLEKYPMRVRIGSGWQFLRDDNDNGNHIAMAYNYLTAGNTFMQGWANNGEVSLSGDVRHPNQYGPLPISGSSGDSGSPMFIYDKTAGKWLINGVLRSGHPYQGKENTYQIARKNYLDEIIAGDLMTVFDFTSASYDWTADGNGSGKLTKGSRVVTNTPLANYSLPSSGRDEFFGYGGPNPYMPALHHGKNIYFGNMENGTITLKNNIDQGAGGLTFEGDFVVQPSTDETWKGAGVSVSEGSTVRWKVKNPEGDRLSKIGQGTLLVNGKGENLGDISVGDGVVVLNQQADEQGKKQAFNQLGIVSGRPTVKLESADQVNPNNIYFGFRGGRLDLNGHSLTFNRIQNTDEGAQIVNHNKDTAATVTLLGNAQIYNESKINQSKAAAFNGWFGETNTGLHNGRLDVVYRPAHADSVFLLSGGTNLNGNITQENGTLVFSGRPTPHAYNHQNRPALIGRPQGEVVIDDDWLNRTFKAKKFIINGGSAVVSRNVSAINGDWQLSNNANAALGVTDKQANFICARSDWTGLTKCANQTLSDKVFSSIERSKINGNFNVSDKATLSVQGLADMVGNVELTANSQYSLIHGATQTGALRLSDNATVRVDNATLIGDVSVANQAQYQLANNATQNGNLTLSDTAQAMVAGAKLNGNTASSQQSQYRLIDGALQTGALTLSNEANALVNNATLSGDVSVANQAQYQLANNATQNGALRLKDHSKALVNAANLKGNVILSEQAELNLNNTTFSHNISGSANSRVMLTNQTNWVLSGSSTVGHLALDNSQVILNSSMNPKTFNNLSVLGDLSGNGSFNYRTYLEHHLGEHVEVNGIAKGNFVLNVNNSGKEPQTLQQLSLLTLKNAAQQAGLVQVSLANGTVDAGTYRYELKNFNNDYRLYNPKKEQEFADQVRLAEEKRKADEATRIAEEKRKAEEAARLAEEKRKAEEAARLAEEKRKADEAARLAEEKRKAEEQARLDAQRKALEQESAVKKQKELISRYANSALSELSASVNSALLAQDALNKHLVSENNTNVWANTLYSSRHYDADEFRAYQQKARLTQVGVQHIDTNHRLGLLFSHSRVSNAFDDNISSKGRLNVLSAFAKYDFENGLNLSADAGYGLSAGEIHGESQNAKIKRRIATIGMGLGYQLNLDKLAIRPHVGIHRYYISADSYTYAGVNVHSPKMSFNAYHAGVTVDYAFMPWEGVTIRPALTLNYVDASDSQVAVQVNQSQLTQRFDRYWQQEIGVTTDFASWQITTYAGKSRGKQLDKQYHIGLKVGYRW
ncbi:S6 family peptidase, partial [uncultured Haemophilus sp.]|uniref:S6 family peptidase n=1 Tax=uncultured Haemophilus sp. TaxID=237779 RepID=UPI0025FD9468